MLRINPIDKKQRRLLMRKMALTAAAAVVPLRGAKAADSTNMITWSVSGSTAMKNFTVAAGITTLEAGDPILTLSNGTYSSGTAGLQLAPVSFSGGGALAGSSGAGVRFEWHEQGSVEGILEMANDEIGYDGGITGTPIIDPNRNASGGNPLHINQGSITAVPGNTGGYGIATSSYNTYDASQYNLTTGENIAGGQNRVEMAISDVVSIEGFSKTSGTTPAGGAPVYGLIPGNTGYGKGNPNLIGGTGTFINGLGIASGRQQLNDDSVLNMTTTKIDPQTGTFYASGAWNTAGVGSIVGSGTTAVLNSGNLINKTVAITATTIAANPGTGLTNMNKGNIQWLETTGRLQNGADFNVTLRDVNSGTHNVFALNTGVDSSWSVGEDDGGNGNPGNAIGTAAQQASIGPLMRFSGKTSGGSQLRPTVQNNRMSVGELGLSDFEGGNTATSSPLRALAYSDTATDVGANFVQPNASTITDGSYVIWQQEQYVTVRPPDANYSNDEAVKGDPSGEVDGDVAKLRDNVLNSVTNFPDLLSANDPADSLLQQSFILPQMMTVSKITDGATTVDISSQVVNGMTHAQWRAALLADPTLPSKFATAAPGSVTAGTGSQYGVVSSAGLTLAGGVTNVPITAQNGSGTASTAAFAPGGNYMFGNFRQDGIRDFDSVVNRAELAQAKLFAVGEASFGAGNGTVAIDVNAANVTVGTLTLSNSFQMGTGSLGISSQLDQMNGHTGPTKGDLVTMGDYNGDGKFDGQDLYLMARGAAISANTGTTLLGGTAATFGDNVRSGVLRKNAALDTLQSMTAPVPGNTDGLNAARLAQRESASPNLTNDPTGANAFNKFDVNRDGVVSRQDAQLVDYFSGTDYRNLNNQLSAVVRTDKNSAGTAFVDGNGQPLDPSNSANAAIPRKSISLVDVELNDTGTIDRTDFNLIRSDLGSNLVDGDANFDGRVDVTDLIDVALHYNTAGDKWSTGDFNGDGVTNILDLQDLAQHWTQQAPGGAPAPALAPLLASLGLPTVVPEPTSLAMIALGAGALLRRRRRIA